MNFIFSTLYLKQFHYFCSDSLYFMFDLNKLIPTYLTERKNIFRLIIFTALFALIFINIYSPFGLTVWYKVTKWELLAYSSMVILIGVLVVAISRLLMFVFYKNRQLTYLQFSLWIFFEVLIMSLFYALFEKIALQDKRFILDILKITTINTTLVLLLPYSVFWLYYSWKDKKDQLEQITHGNVTIDSYKMIAFYDEKGVLRLSLKTENLLYIEASDNYVNIYYLNKDKITRFLLRNSLKSMEQLFKGTDIIRCHRSYMVNFKKVRVIRKEKDGLHLELDLEQILDLPVSKTYSENVMNIFVSYCKNIPSEISLN